MSGQELGGETHDAYFVHPPYQGGTGATFWEREVTVPKGGRLEFFTGMGERSPGRSDGVVFQVLVAPAGGETGGSLQAIFQHKQVASRWERQAVSLKPWQGKRIRLRFVSHCGPQGNSTTDHSYWGAVRVRSSKEGPWTPPVRHMTWVDGKPFRSGFTFSDVRSSEVDLEVRVEGSEPLWIGGLSVHAGPDVMYREFEKGLVVANPGPRAVEFPLKQHFPEQRFRRLRASSRQDTRANDGSLLGPMLKLGPREGLFLVRVGVQE
jgi:hypothetical protein